MNISTPMCSSLSLKEKERIDRKDRQRSEEKGGNKEKR